MNGPESKEYIAIIGMAGRFPGAKNLQEFWQNLSGGVESITFFPDEELLAAGIDREVISNPVYVRARGILEDVDKFDAKFFGYSPREAKIMDPQHRFFLECAHEALENAGYDSERCQGAIAVYAGVSMNNYLINIYSDRNLVESVGDFQIAIGTDKDFLSTRVSYKLNLKGPSLTVQTACSTSLVAVDLACQSLLTFQSDMAIAGGVSISVPQESGYLYQEGGVLSPDGHCRAFDIRAQGTVGGNGVGIVVLKRLSDSIADRDHIHAVIKGSAINNDGSLKAGYTAPSVDGQAEVIAAAQAAASVSPDTISYVEAHGTATPLGDPIEVAALKKAFCSSPCRPRSCALGSVKTNIGHLDAAAGVAGLIKTVLALKHRLIPPSLHYQHPNPNIDFDQTPFYVNRELRAWEALSGIRRAGVSSFGIGGTNAHVIVEEWEQVQSRRQKREGREVIVVSGRSLSAMERMSQRVRERLKQMKEEEFGDAAYTLAVGRRSYEHRKAVVCSDIEQAISGLARPQRPGGINKVKEAGRPAIIFMFPGQGSQYVNMGLGLYKQEEEFRYWVDELSQEVKSEVGIEIREAIYPAEGEQKMAAEMLRQTRVTQPALYVVEYALARQLMKWGVSPNAMIGHSLGEYVAATVAGVFEARECARLVAVRAKLMQEMRRGGMLSVMGSEQEVRKRLTAGLSIAAVNSSRQCVVSGECEEIDALERRMVDEGVVVRRLKVRQAFHSRMMEGASGRYREEVRKVKMGPIEIRYISNVSGRWAEQEEVKEEEYWVKQMMREVRYEEGMEEILRSGEGGIYIEVGPGGVLRELAKEQRGWGERGEEVVRVMKKEKEEEEDEEVIKRGLGRMWERGVEVDWAEVMRWEEQGRRKVEMPTYAFEGERYWVESNPIYHAALEDETKRDKSEWLYVPIWRQQSPVNSSAKSAEADDGWLLFAERSGLSKAISDLLKESGQKVIEVEAADEFCKLSEDNYAIKADRPEDYQSVMDDLRKRSGVPRKIIHLWGARGIDEGQSGADQPERSEREITDGFYSLIYVAQELGKEDLTRNYDFVVVVIGTQEVTGAEKIRPERALALGPCKVIPQEYGNVRCKAVDIESDIRGRAKELAEQLIEEVRYGQAGGEIAIRGNRRWVKTYERVGEAREGKELIRERGVYLITGGGGGVGLALGEYLGRTKKARVVLVDRKWKQNADAGESDASEVVRKIEQAGGEAWVLGADVCCPEEMRLVISQAHARFGRIHGVIHSAGNIAGGLIQLKTKDMVADVLAPKMGGTRVLEFLLANTDLDFVVLCSSMDSIIGVLGQVDYTAANAFLDAFAYYNTRKSGVYTVSINWGTWRDVGMAVSAEIPRGLEDDQRQKLMLGMTTEEAVETFNRILSYGIGPQVIVSPTDLSLAIKQADLLKPAKYLEDANNGRLHERNAHSTQRQRSPDGYEKAGQQRPRLHPLLDEEVVSPEIAGLVFQKRFALHRDVIIRDHQIQGNPILPAAGFLEMALASARQHFKQSAFRLTDVAILAPLGIARAETALAQVLLKATDSADDLRFRIVSRSDARKTWTEHVTGRLSTQSTLDPAESIDLEHIEGRLPQRVEATELYSINSDCGPYFRSIEWLRSNGREALARLRLPPPARKETGHVLHPSLVDGAIQTLLALLFASRPDAASADFYLPIGVESVVVMGQLPDVVYSHATCLGEECGPDEGGDTRRGKLTLLDDQGRVLAMLEGIILRKARIAVTEASDRNGDEASALVVAPRDEFERGVAEIWKELLGVETVSIHDNFFGLGGHSLLAIQVLSRLIKEFNVKLSMKTIFETPTIADLAMLVKQELALQNDADRGILPRNAKTVDELMADLD
jgi:acyl transferase domain-containing protein